MGLLDELKAARSEPGAVPCYGTVIGIKGADRWAWSPVVLVLGREDGSALSVAYRPKDERTALPLQQLQLQPGFSGFDRRWLDNVLRRLKSRNSLFEQREIYQLGLLGKPLDEAAREILYEFRPPSTQCKDGNFFGTARTDVIRIRVAQEIARLQQIGEIPGDEQTFGREFANRFAAEKRRIDPNNPGAVDIVMRTGLGNPEFNRAQALLLWSVDAAGQPSDPIGAFAINPGNGIQSGYAYLKRDLDDARLAEFTEILRSNHSGPFNTEFVDETRQKLRGKLHLGRLFDIAVEDTLLEAVRVLGQRFVRPKPVTVTRTLSERELGS